jgi:hypothetical protein
MLNQNTAHILFEDSFLIRRDNKSISLGRISLETHSPVSIEDYDHACEAIERIKSQLRALACVIPDEQVQPTDITLGEAQDPALITSKLPGIDLTDRRRGPRKEKQ